MEALRKGRKGREDGGYDFYFSDASSKTALMESIQDLQNISDDYETGPGQSYVKKVLEEMNKLYQCLSWPEVEQLMGQPWQFTVG